MAAPIERTLAEQGRDMLYLSLRQYNILVILIIGITEIVLWWQVHIVLAIFAFLLNYGRQYGVLAASRALKEGRVKDLQRIERKLIFSLWFTAISISMALYTGLMLHHKHLVATSPQMAMLQINVENQSKILEDIKKELAKHSRISHHLAAYEMLNGKLERAIFTSEQQHKTQLRTAKQNLAAFWRTSYTCKTRRSGYSCLPGSELRASQILDADCNGLPSPYKNSRGKKMIRAAGVLCGKLKELQAALVIPESSEVARIRTQLNNTEMLAVVNLQARLEQAKKEFKAVQTEFAMGIASLSSDEQFWHPFFVTTSKFINGITAFLGVNFSITAQLIGFLIILMPVYIVIGGSIELTKFEQSIRDPIARSQNTDIPKSASISGMLFERFRGFVIRKMGLDIPVAQPQASAAQRGNSEYQGSFAGFTSGSVSNGSKEEKKPEVRSEFTSVNYDTVIAMYKDGIKAATIAAEMGLNRTTVYRYIAKSKQA